MSLRSWGISVRGIARGRRRYILNYFGDDPEWSAATIAMRTCRAFDASSIDALAVYCPSPRTFAYLLASELNASYVNLRFSKAKNGQVKRTRDAADYRDPWRMFGAVALDRDGQPMVAKVGDGMPA
jgi:hypothetical protein